ncbi:hypothetical protein HanIR_Chr16g0818101 [Helianthus annuus]|nr:hypothetical protein HanIR_Chr16g0818101 [Helianthus annuus]
MGPIHSHQSNFPLFDFLFLFLFLYCLKGAFKGALSHTVQVNGKTPRLYDA